MFFYYAFKFGGKTQNSPVDLVSCLSCCKVKLQIYSYSYDDEGIKLLESSHGQVPLIITADGVRPCVSGCPLCPVG